MLVGLVIGLSAISLNPFSSKKELKQLQAARLDKRIAQEKKWREEGRQFNPNSNYEVPESGKWILGDNWFKGGNLHKASVIQWKRATYQNKLATAGDWLTATLWKGHLNSYKDFDRLKVKAEMLVRALDSSLSAIPIGNEAEDMLVAEAAVFLIHTANDLGPDS